MIDINKIVTSAIDDNLDSFVKEVNSKPSKNDLESKSRVYEALMNYSGLLLTKYHQSLKVELAKHDIEI